MHKLRERLDKLGNMLTEVKVGRLFLSWWLLVTTSGFVFTLHACIFRSMPILATGVFISYCSIFGLASLGLAYMLVSEIRGKGNTDRLWLDTQRVCRKDGKIAARMITRR